ncbi:glycerophosphodiester phosphodiesterase [Desulfospira joergensenii]|uniref:glycerophosphodiester phosphodiesterase n=1 Tax=Desulfospira joergensenii TaxID=53329 RepID=UPI0003B66F17|nr:glycerophosphodiester phosphodiesterase family protein [Desulfospira joergensenii]
MVEIIAHRGARSLAPENTLAAARIGHRVGAHRWETDVSLTLDRSLVLFHDKDLLRCTDAKKRFGPKGSGRSGEYLLADTPLEQVLELDAGAFFPDTDPFSTIGQGKMGNIDPEKFRGEKIPTLDQGLALTKKLDWKINLELKDHGREPEPFYTARQTLAAIEKSGISKDSLVISSFNLDWLKWLRTQTRDIELQALVGDSGEEELDFEDFSFSAYNVNAFMITPEIITMLKDKGKRINLWTVNDMDEAARFMDAGVDGIITDFPQNFSN